MIPCSEYMYNLIRAKIFNPYKGSTDYVPSEDWIAPSAPTRDTLYAGALVHVYNSVLPKCIYVHNFLLLYMFTVAIKVVMVPEKPAAGEKFLKNT